jgi:hypothetical protein
LVKANKKGQIMTGTVIQSEEFGCPPVQLVMITIRTSGASLRIARQWDQLCTGIWATEQMEFSTFRITSWTG